MLDLRITCEEQRESITGISHMFLAPEIMTGKVSKKADIWSLGVIMYLLVTGRFNFGKVKVGRQRASHANTPIFEFKESRWSHHSQ